MSSVLTAEWGRFKLCMLGYFLFLSSSVTKLALVAAALTFGGCYMEWIIFPWLMYHVVDLGMVVWITWVTRTPWKELSTMEHVCSKRCKSFGCGLVAMDEYKAHVSKMGGYIDV